MAQKREYVLTTWDSEHGPVDMHQKSIYHHDGYLCTTYEKSALYDGSEGEFYNMREDPGQRVNLWADPEAADMVFSYGGPLIMSGLDVTHRFQALPHRIDMVRALPGRLAAVLADLLDFFSETYRSRHHHITGAAVHDPCAVMALTHPFLFRREFRHVEIETHGLRTAGMTIIDQRDLKEVPDANCDVQVDVDADAAWDVVVEAIAHFSR